MSTRAAASRAKAGRLAQRRAAEDAVKAAPDEGTEHERPAAQPPSRAARTRPVRVSLDLAPTLYRDLSDWNAHTADQLDRSRITHADTLRVLVRRLLRDPELSAAVVDDLRSQ